MVLHMSKHSLPEAVRSVVAQLLNARLADCLDLQTQARQARWNVRGPSFGELRALFDEISRAVAAHADTLAERAVQLGGTVAGTARAVAAGSSLPEYPRDISTGADHVAALSDSLGAFGALTRQGISAASALGDAATADIFTEVTRGIDKWLWMVEAHLELEPAEPALALMRSPEAAEARMRLRPSLAHT